ncbi:hypothetical protein C1H46_031370 [Malus baccata]|uniref:Ribosomal RNA-processing protein 42 n=1 Tax=Malus baccata TaxID=106549 RepID=A0A540L983_MALBA|nr:hypothetical protein C1H46_031370 [Malus baccata]
MGATDVIASVKAELGRPTALQPDKGKVFINVDCSPTAAPVFEVPLLVSGAGIDLSFLVVVEGKICCDLYIDGLVVSSDGNLLDALGAAIKEKELMFPKAALSDTGIPRVNVAAGASGKEQPEVDVSDDEFLQFDTSKVPVIVTLTKVGKHYIVDATSEEESQMSSAVSISVNRQGHICELTKRGVSELLINTLDSQIAAAEAGEDESGNSENL